MKTLINRMFGVVISIIAFGLAAQGVSAQTKEDIHELSSFNSIDIQDDFEVTVTKGNYSVKVTVDALLSDYVKSYVKGHTLYLFLDEKAVPKDVKKLYKGRNGMTPIMRATVYTPDLESVVMSDQAALTVPDEYPSGSFMLSMTDKSVVRALSVNCTTANVSMKKNAQANLTLTAVTDVVVSTENSAKLQLSGSCKDLSLSASGSSEQNVTSDAGTLTVNTDGSSSSVISSNSGRVYVSCAGSSKLQLNGTASTLTAKGARSCNIDALNMPVEEAEVTMNSGSITLTPSKLLTVDLSSGSSVYYNGSPEFKISQILKSTLAPYGTK